MFVAAGTVGKLELETAQDVRKKMNWRQVILVPCKTARLFFLLTLLIRLQRENVAGRNPTYAPRSGSFVPSHEALIVSIHDAQKQEKPGHQAHADACTACTSCSSWLTN